MRAESNSKSKELPGILDFPWLEEGDAEFKAPLAPAVSPAEKIVQFSQPLDAIALGMQLVQVLPILQQVLQRQAEIFGQMKSMQVQISGMQKPNADQPEWLDAEGALKYLSMSKNTFEKHVYSAKVKIRRHPVGGKNYFKKSELDLFMLTWEDKNLS